MTRLSPVNSDVPPLFLPCLPVLRCFNPKMHFNMSLPDPFLIHSVFLLVCLLPDDDARSLLVSLATNDDDVIREMVLHLNQETCM